ncbi:hypothetical protein [Vagococcus hydrophili]|uniref:Gram-positive cocci surface proteins LPxTG domain-containing protein n=1 Tax=Vagococcus hydrophili TaxID=2714947 RepID=A0A6G8AT42_9ENTE|nr:hypothetical protein [Vagococcus hydrophili]QIL48234.1 hypothetical protein G7082_06890 [Vagococcus hydrophili]
MKLFKLSCLVLLFISLSLAVPSLVSANDDHKTQAEVILKKTKDSEPKPTKPKESIYTPEKAKPVRFLPQTGEIVASFMYIIIGLCFLIFILGMLMNRATKIDVRWDY